MKTSHRLRVIFWACIVIFLMPEPNASAQNPLLPPPRVNYPSGGFADAQGVIQGWYRRYLGRDAEAAGLAGWVNEMRKGKSLRDIQIQLLSSDEFYARAGQRPDLFIRTLFQQELGRIPTASEMDQWQRRLRKLDDKRSKLVREFLDWCAGQAQVPPVMGNRPSDQTRQLVDETWVLVESARRELAGTVQGRQVMLRANALLGQASDLQRLSITPGYRPEQFRTGVLQVERSLAAVEEALAWPAGTAPNSGAVARRLRFLVDSLTASVGLPGPIVPGPSFPTPAPEYDVSELDEEVEELGEELEIMIRILKFPIRPTYVDTVVLRDLSSMAGQVADFRSLIWDRASTSSLRAAHAHLQRLSGQIGPNLAATSQPAAATRRWYDVEKQLERIGRDLGVANWPGPGGPVTYPPIGNIPNPSASLPLVIDALIADVDIFLESLTPIITSYPDAFWLQAECRRLRANLLLMRELSRRGASPPQLRDQLRRAVGGYQRIQDRLAGARSRSSGLTAPDFRARLAELEQLIGS